ISIDVIQKLKLNIEKNTPIYISQKNIEHIKNKHFKDYDKYGNQIENIIKYPTYIAKHPKDGSIEYIKKYILNNEYVFVAVRVTSNNINFVRTMFVMTDKKVNIYINNNYFIKYNCINKF
ncbi:MAG: PBECR2 nuclease fold domain-containing protein, partial [Clostridia bacterium]